MSFKTFLLNEGRSEELAEYEAVELYKKHCKEYIWDNQTMYRGVKSTVRGFKVVDPSKHERKSANTANFYTLWMDNSKKWVNYPKRSESAICTSELSVATGYGTPYLMIPFDGATLGVCPASDIWESFWDELDKLDVFALSGFNDYVWNMIGAMIDNNLTKEDIGKDYKTLVRYIKKADMMLKKHPDQAEKKIVNAGWDDDIFPVLKKFGGLEKIMDMVLDPKSNRFSVIPFKKFKHENYPFKEVWTDSKCLMIPTNPVVMDSFKEKVR